MAPLPLSPFLSLPSPLSLQQKNKNTKRPPLTPQYTNSLSSPPLSPERPNLLHQSSSSSSFLCIAFFLASNASAKLPAKFGFDELAPFSAPPLRLIPESLACSAAGFLPAAGLFAGGAGGVGFALPFGAGGGGGARGAGAGAAACSST